MTLMDGTKTCEGIRGRFLETLGQPLPAESLLSMLEQLEQAHFLEGEGFEEYYNARQAEYRSAGARTTPQAVPLGVQGDPAEFFARVLGKADRLPLAGRVVGLIAPHLDYQRGEPCYAAAYAALPQPRAVDRVVILGTNHFGRSMSVVATTSDFTTPLGTSRTDRVFLERLEARCGNLREYELDHLREHSVELQVMWLQHIYGAESFEMVPLLCPDPCGPTGTAPLDGNGVDLREFATALRELIEGEERATLVVAGADLSHVGAAFGDERKLDGVFAEEVRQRDRRALDKLEINDPDAFLRCVSAKENITRICSGGCIFVLSSVLPRATGTVLRYHQAVDEPSQTCVTCAAVAFT